jgi:hypothetical protein
MELTKEQQTAISQISGDLQLIVCAGSGKTEVVGLTDETLNMADVVTLIDKRDEERLGEKRAAMLDPQAKLAEKLSYSN